ncbi:MAG TPA: hemolysin family protein [Jatrophihabitans sp.]|jgi:CBS domain containing-hemolysin-like protein|uniref:hemolysin family protein n=1 Tax=Jatrophihabitans sp. TaxID=1932789 RepID=UPI002DF827BC|nr:hemolysin family protein [Jatrophihabitans sp.]
MTEWLLLALSLVLIAVCGVFVAGEFALMTTDRATVERVAATGDKRAGGVLAAMRSLSTQLSGVQVAITLTNLAIGFLSEPAIAQLLHAPLAAVGVHGSTAVAVAVAVALVTSTVLTMVFGELVPKNLALALPLAVARAVQGPVRAFTRVMRTPIRALNRVADGVLHLFGLEAREELASARTPDELLSLVRHSASEGTLAVGTATLLVRSLAFGDKHARDVLTARPQMVAVAARDTVAAMLDVVRASGHSRLPVLGPHGLDDVTGVVELDQAVAVPVERRESVLVRDVMRAPVEVPESLPLDAVLQALQAGRSQLALVVDEYGGTAGVVTGEDLLEELVGEVEDEHDAPMAPARRVGDGFDVSGLLRPDEVRAATGLTLPEHGVYETVGGLVMRELGRLPVTGDRVAVADVELTVLRMDGRRVDRLLVTARTEAGA